MSTAINPFYFGNKVYGDDFCNRAKELEALKKGICDKKHDKYYLIDPFIKYWLEKLG